MEIKCKILFNEWLKRLWSLLSYNISCYRHHKLIRGFPREPVLKRLAQYPCLIDGECIRVMEVSWSLGHGKRNRWICRNDQSESEQYDYRSSCLDTFQVCRGIVELYGSSWLMVIQIIPIMRLCHPHGQPSTNWGHVSECRELLRMNRKVKGKSRIRKLAKEQLSYVLFIETLSAPKNDQSRHAIGNQLTEQSWKLTVESLF